MNTAILLLTALTLTTARYPELYVLNPLGGHPKQMQTYGVITIPTTSPSLLYQESRHYEGRDAHVQKAAGHGSGNHEQTSGGVSVGHHETGKSGQELRETAKKEEGSHKGDKAAHTDSSHAEKSGKSHMGQKHHRHHKAGGKKKGGKVSKGFNEQYHKNEKKSKGAHWKYEHTDGKYIKYGKKRGKGGDKHAKNSGKVEKRNDDGNANRGFENMDHLITVLWSTNKKPVYNVVNHSYSGEQ